MRAYDFDGTIYDGDSTSHFLLFCVRKNPALALRGPGIAVQAVRFLTHRMERQAFKQYVFASILPKVDAVGLVDEFWARHESRVKSWYLQQRRPDDLVISASPQFLLQPICDRWGVELIATQADPHTGKILGSNMRKDQKVTAFLQAHPHEVPEEFYSDDPRADEPMMRLAQRAYLVRGDRVTPYSFPK